MRRRLMKALFVAAATLVISGATVRPALAGCDWVIVDWVWNEDIQDYEPVWEYQCWPDPPPPPEWRNLNIIAYDSRTGAGICGSNVHISIDFGNGQEGTTGCDGLANFGVTRWSHIDFSINAGGYFSYGGSVDIDGDVAVSAPLTNVWRNLNVFVRDALTGNPVCGAIAHISIDFGNGTNRTTGCDGFANFGVQTYSTLTYTVSAANHNPQSGTVYMADDTTLTISLVRPTTRIRTLQTTPGRPANSRLSGSGIPFDPSTGEYGCNASISFADHWVEVDTVISDPNGNILKSDYKAGWHNAESSISAALTVTGQYYCTADFHVDGYFLAHDSTRDDYFLIMLDITINTFIPENNYPFALPAEENNRLYTAGGDDRGFSRTGSFRSNQVASIYAAAAGVDLVATQSGAGGLTEIYEYFSSVGPDHRLTAEAKNDWILNDDYLKVGVGQSSGATLQCSSTKHSLVSMTLHCEGNESTPIFFFAPGITYHFDIQFWFNANGTADYLVLGGHDAFPSYEVYVGDQRIYEWDHGTYDILWLLPPEDVTGIFVPGRVN